MTTVIFVNKRYNYFFSSSAILLILLLSLVLSSCKFKYMFSEPPIEELKKNALKGDLEAQKLLYYKYYYGENVEINYKEAAKWITMAAEQDDVPAMRSLANMYRNGKGIEKDYAKSMQLYTKSAYNNDWIAQIALAYEYDKGEIVKRNDVEAAAWAMIGDDNKNNYGSKHIYYYELLDAETKTKAMHRAQEIKKNIRAYIF